MRKLSKDIIDDTFKLLNDRMEENASPPAGIVVCGGSALIACNFVKRTTKDVDIVALVNGRGILVEPVPLPEGLMIAARQIANLLNLPADWINNGPSSGEGGIFQLGLPDFFEQRLKKVTYGKILTVYFISRIDQIYFKLWASADRGGYHIDDLLALMPTEQEILSASKWSMGLDPSEGYRMVLIELLNNIGFQNAAKRI